jgi:hypothetical protein
MYRFQALATKLYRERYELSIGAAAIFAILFSIKDSATYPWFKAIMASAVVCLFLINRKPHLTMGFWVLLLAYHIPLLSKNMYHAANHYFVLVYMMMAILIFLYSSFHKERYRFHIRWILSCILLFGGIHKLLEPTYINGSFFMYQINMGVFLKPFANAIPEWKEAILQNVKFHRELQKSPPGIPLEFALIPPANPLRSIGLIFGWGAIIMEIGAGALVALIPQKKITHIFVATTILSVFLFRFETGFLSLLAAMGLALSPSRHFATLYFLLYLVFIGFVLSGLGLK